VEQDVRFSYITALSSRRRGDSPMTSMVSVRLPTFIVKRLGGLADRNHHLREAGRPR
jgi:hypothetical protein